MWEASPELDASTTACVAERQVTLFMTLCDMTLLYLFLLPLPLQRKFKKMIYCACSKSTSKLGNPWKRSSR